MEIALLGPVEIARDGTAVGIGGGRQRALLALLALEAGRTVAADRIIEEIWGRTPPAKPANALQAAVSRLRRAVGAAGIVARGPGYALDVDPAVVDVERFRRWAVRGREALAAGDAAGAVVAFDAALGLWRGEPLAELADHPFAVAAAAGLREERAALVEDRAEARLALGEHAELIAELRAAVAEEPLRERRREQLVLSLYRSGRQADALRAFQDARAALVEELGIEPSPRLRELERAVLEQDPELEGPVPSARSAASPAPPTRTAGVPRARSSFVGRDDDLRGVVAALRAARLVTLTGPGGAGKSRLAMEVAARLEDEAPVWWVELAPVGPVDVETRVARAVAGDPAGAAELDAVDPDPLERVARHVGERTCLLVIDNCEHVVDAAAKVADGLLDMCPGLRVLATSREGLAIDGEHLWPLEPLAAAPAVELFVARACAAVPGFELADADRAEVEEICARLDGLPLAIELAAARVAALPLPVLRARLDDRFRLLTGAGRGTRARHQTLRSVMDWSYELLPDAERRVFARLSVCVGGAAVDTAESVVAGGPVDRDDVVPLLVRLVERSLVVSTGDPSGDVRFTMLETLRAYARERLDEYGEHDECAARHARFFAELARRADPELRGGAQRAWSFRLDREAENLRAALEWSAAHDPATCTVLVARTAWWMFLRGRTAELEPWFETVLTSPVDLVDPAERALAMLWIGFVGTRDGHPLGRRCLDEALESFGDAGDLEGLALVAVARLAGSLRDASRDVLDAQIEQARQAATRAGNKWAAAVVQLIESDVAHAIGDVARAERSARAGLETFRALGDDWGTAQLTMALGHLLESRGDYEGAHDAYRASRDLARNAGLVEYEAYMTGHLGNVAALLGDHDVAGHFHARAIEIARRGGVASLSFALSAAGFGARRAGALEVSRRYLEESLALYERAQWRAGEAYVCDSLGRTESLAGDDERARALHLRAYRIARELGAPRAVAYSLEGLALALARSDPQRAGRLLGVAEALREASGGPLPPAERAEVDRAEGLLRDAIGPEGLLRAVRAGRRLTGHLDALVSGADGS